MVTESIELLTGDILHCKGHGFIAWGIKKFTKSPFTHSAIVVECWGQVYVVDMQNKGISPKPLEAWLRKYNYSIEVARPKTGPKNPKAFSIRAFTKVGLTGYDYINLLFRHPWKVISGTWLTDKSFNKNKMTCSEYIAWLYHIENPYRITPKLLRGITQEGEFDHYEYLYQY